MYTAAVPYRSSFFMSQKRFLFFWCPRFTCVSKKSAFIASLWSTSSVRSCFPRLQTVWYNRYNTQRKDSYSGFYIQIQFIQHLNLAIFCISRLHHFIVSVPLKHFLPGKGIVYFRKNRGIWKKAAFTMFLYMIQPSSHFASEKRLLIRSCAWLLPIRTFHVSG